MKICSSCNSNKDYNEFYKSPSYKDGYMNQCKICKIEYGKKYRNDNKEKVSTINSISSKKWRENNKDKSNERVYNWKIKNKEHLKNYHQEYYISNQSSIKEYRLTNKEKTKEYNTEYYKINRHKILENNYKYKSDSKINVSLFKISENLRSMISNSFKLVGSSKSLKTENILGCTFEEFKDYLESKFEDWMTWDNRGLYNGELNYGWDIDHIIPLSIAETEEEIIKLNHYTNLQPLCSKVNRYIKKNKYEYEIY